MTHFWVQGKYPWVEGYDYDVDPDTGCWVWKRSRSIRATPYAVSFRRRYVEATGTGYAHRQAYIAIHGPVGRDIHVHHRCHNTLCVNVEHLEATPANLHERHHRELDSKLTHADVIAIREAAWNGERGIDLARQYGLTTTQIGFMCDGSKWKHVGGPIGKPPKACLTCGIDISHKVQARKASYCSGACKQKASYRRMKARKLAPTATGEGEASDGR